MSRRSFSIDTRGVQWTLEAFLAVLILFAALGFAIQTNDPGRQQQADQLSGSQLEQTATDILSVSKSTGALKDSVLYYNNSTKDGTGTDGRFIGAAVEPDYQSYVSLAENKSHPLYPLITESVGQKSVAYNLYFIYEDAASDNLSEQRVVYQGSPGEQAVSTTSTVVLQDSDRLANDGCTLDEDTGDPCNPFGMQDAYPSSTRYNVVQVRLVLWPV